MKPKPPTALARRGAAIPTKASARSLLADVRELIVQAREGVAQTVNAGLVLHYWHVGQRIREDILRAKRAEYAKELVVTLSQQLTAEFGSGYSRSNLARMIQFAEAFPEAKIVVALTRQLGWSHFVTRLPIGNPLRRDFYAGMCGVERRQGARRLQTGENHE